MQITKDLIRSVGEAGGIPEEEWPRLGQQLTRARQGYIKAKEIYDGLRTKREKLVIWRKAEKAVRALDEQLNPTVRGYMIGHEELVCKKEKSVAAASVQRDLDAVASLRRRIRSIITVLEKRPVNLDERIASAGATKSDLMVFDSYIVSFWLQLNRSVSFAEGSGFVAFFRAFNEAAIPFSRSEELSADTVKSKVKRERKWRGR